MQPSWTPRSSPTSTWAPCAAPTWRACAEVRERLAAALAEADHVVLLGDLLELRERPALELLELARPTLEAVGRAIAGRRVTLVPGNHDHALVAPLLERARLSGEELGPEQEWSVAPGDGPAGRIAEWMPGTELALAYPGFRPRPDVYVTHGHYVDAHLSLPRMEAVVASAMSRLTGRGRPSTAADHEAVLGPIYAFADALAQGAVPKALSRGSETSRGVWDKINGDRRGASGFLLGRVAIPGGVALLNLAGLGPYSSEITGHTLRRSGLDAMRAVVAGMGVDAEHVVFGHTHRAGPWPEDDPAEWALPNGGRLTNSGCWFREAALMRDNAEASPYFPGTVVRLRDYEPPALERALAGSALPSSS